jgi:hypothetical protein
MANSMRFFFAALSAAAFLTLAIVRPDWLRHVGVEVATFDRVRKPTFDLEPSPEVVQVTNRIAAKTRVVVRLEARELDLFEAAAHFRELDSAAPDFSAFAWSRFPGETDAEKRCRQVICWVDVHAGQHLPPDERTRILADLEKALAVRLYQEGRFDLPEPR